jgi:hypothetical protein
MKRLILVLAMVMLLVVSASAADVVLNGRTFIVTQNDQLLLLTFQQGPFGPNEMGYATLSCDGFTSVPIPYMFENPYCTFSIDDMTVRYALIGSELIFAPENALNFTEQVVAE